MEQSSFVFAARSPEGKNEAFRTGAAEQAEHRGNTTFIGLKVHAQGKYALRQWHSTFLVQVTPDVISL